MAPAPQTSARASTSLVVLVLPASAFHAAMQLCPDLDAYLWRHVARNLVQKLMSVEDPSQSPDELRELAEEWVPENCVPPSYDKDEEVALATAAIERAVALSIASLLPCPPRIAAAARNLHRGCRAALANDC